MSCGKCSHRFVCKYKPVSPCPVYPNDAALEECGTQPTATNSAMLEIALVVRELVISNRASLGQLVYDVVKERINAVVDYYERRRKYRENKT